MKIVDSILTTYKELFTITFLHTDFQKVYSYINPEGSDDEEISITTSSIFQVLNIKPDKDTLKLFSDFSIGSQSFNNIFCCFMRVQSENPFINLPETARIRLLLNPKGDFLSRTKMSGGNSHRVYRLSNSNDTLEDSYVHLTKNHIGVTDDDLENLSLLDVDDKCIGVIDISNTVVNENYRLLNENVLQRPAFVIRFINKH